MAVLAMINLAGCARPNDEATKLVQEVLMRADGSLLQSLNQIAGITGSMRWDESKAVNHPKNVRLVTVFVSRPEANKIKAIEISWLVNTESKIIELHQAKLNGESTSPLSLSITLPFILLVDPGNTGVNNYPHEADYTYSQEFAKRKFYLRAERFFSMGISDLASDVEARAIGKILFDTNCSQCHGVDGKGVGAVTDLTDNKWLFGGDDDDIWASIANGRLAEMPSNMLGDEQSAREVANYVLAMGGRPHDPSLAAVGQFKYSACAGCHDVDGTGMPAAGFPNIVDDAWQYGGTVEAITQSIINGRKGSMPGFYNVLDGMELQLLTAYVKGLSRHDKY